MHANRRKSFPVLSLCGLLAAAGGCTSSKFVRKLSVNPPEASVYVNGVRVGAGDARPYTFDFGQVGRIYVQATHPDYLPATEWFTPEKIQQLVDTNTDIRITLRPR